MKKFNYKEKIIFTILFTIFGLIALQVPFSRILGSGAKFTLFDFMAPTAGAFLGTAPGVISVSLIQILNVALHGGKIPDIGSIIRLFPTLFAVFYFAKKRRVNLLIPILAIITFNLHPIGRSAWQYSLFWLIPIISHFFHKNLFVRSLGATFTAHAVGSSLWVWAFGLTKEMWISLIPQTAMERVLFASGISVFYIVSTNVLYYAVKRRLLPFSLKLEKQYLLS